ncbi:hypothetical protein TIFTF001_018809 [Ficus carica]|uniref:Uncharacterized protein n=1 Tax=Ficus carica TaxID=3494 RepID=A0AA88DB35_FICCA|nr:hypothetical protein TIFTF001_018809 [Ficus carica]
MIVHAIALRGGPISAMGGGGSRSCCGGFWVFLFGRYWSVTGYYPVGGCGFQLFTTGILRRRWLSMDDQMVTKQLPTGEHLLAGIVVDGNHPITWLPTIDWPISSWISACILVTNRQPNVYQTVTNRHPSIGRYRHGR